MCTTKFLSKRYTSKRTPLCNLFNLNNCVKKNVHGPFFVRNACLPYRKNGFQAHFFRFAHFFRESLLYLKLVALPRALQTKRLGTTHFFVGGHWSIKGIFPLFPLSNYEKSWCADPQYGVKRSQRIPKKWYEHFQFQNLGI